MKKLILGMALLFCLVQPITTKASELTAEENPEIYAARNGILQVNLVYVDEENNEHVIQGGSGFLIGNEEGAQYIVTDYSRLNVTEDIRQKVLTQFERDSEDKADLQFEVQAVVKRDITLDAEIVTGSEEMNIAVLKLDKPLYDRTSLMLDVNDEMILETASVYTLGFPEDIQMHQDVSYYTQDDVSVMNGIVSKKTVVNGILYIQHSAVITEGNSGGPLLNESGHVIGLNQILLDDGYYYSLHISEVTAVLDALGIPYDKYIPEEIVDTGVLQTAVSVAENKDLSKYTEESSQYFLQVLEESRNVLSQEELTQESVDQCLLNLKSAEAALEVKSGMSYLVIGGIIIFILLVLIIILIVCIIKKGKGEKKEKRIADTSHVGRLSPSLPTMGSRYTPLQQGVVGETMLLNTSTNTNKGGETTVLGAGYSADLIPATMIRVKTNETIQIRKVMFYLGKDAQKVDYCIKDNPSISRSHAVIRQINGGLYLEDLQATNGTYHNGVKLQAGQSVKLANGDRIRLADEEFRITIQ